MTTMAATKKKVSGHRVLEIGVGSVSESAIAAMQAHGGERQTDRELIETIKALHAAGKISITKVGGYVVID